jgi:hypothetical protein
VRATTPHATQDPCFLSLLSYGAGSQPLRSPKCPLIGQWKAAHPGAAVVVRANEGTPTARRFCLDRRSLYAA